MSAQPEPVAATAAETPSVPEPPARGEHIAFRPYLFEIVVLAAALLAIVFLRRHGLRMDRRTAIILWNPTLLLPWALFIGIAMQLAYRRLAHLPVRAYLREVVRPRWWILWLRLSLALIVMQYGYFWVKVSVPLINPRLWDDALWRLDTWLHFGLSPTVFIVNLFTGTSLVLVLDLWYDLWVWSVFYTLAFWTASLDSRLRRRVLLSSVLLWTLGSWFYMAVPALGPVYVAPQTFASVTNDLPAAGRLQGLLWENYQWVLEGRRTGILRRFRPTHGVASMPSLHVAAHFLFFLWARRRARPLAVFFALATALTFAGSLLTGWHYAVDGYAGMLLAWLCYRAGRWGDGADPVPAMGS